MVTGNMHKFAEVWFSVMYASGQTDILVRILCTSWLCLHINYIVCIRI